MKGMCSGCHDVRDDRCCRRVRLVLALFILIDGTGRLRRQGRRRSARGRRRSAGLRRRGIQRAAPGRAAGTVGSVSSSGFTMTTSAGQSVTVDEASSTKYSSGSDATSASAIADGTLVLVLGTVNSTTITAAQVDVESAGNKYTASSSQVVKFQRGDPSTSKSTGTIPPDWSEGQGDDRQRDDRGRGDGGGPGRLSGRCRGPGREAEQRRLQRPLHRCQLAAPRLPQR